ncbi:uncharacterized protein MONOS_18377 [Monocercomonoides exilis]|uniref:uncharacterized protein n=1 Tax=Monocercomonoides exilis TaxID=2049356 RepID=UPI00355A1DB1|nr:hypothetical protein MONOS_18377 [Monocercomonoides exilis]
MELVDAMREWRRENAKRWLKGQQQQQQKKKNCVVDPRSAIVLGEAGAAVLEGTIVEQSISNSKLCFLSPLNSEAIHSIFRGKQHFSMKQLEIYAIRKNPRLALSSEMLGPIQKELKEEFSAAVLILSSNVIPTGVKEGCCVDVSSFS